MLARGTLARIRDAAVSCMYDGAEPELVVVAVVDVSVEDDESVGVDEAPC